LDCNGQPLALLSMTRQRYNGGMSESNKTCRTADESSGRRVNWRNKFRVAIRGALWAIRSEVNFKIHLAIGLAVIATAAWLGASAIEWSILVLCIIVVLSAEAFNTAIEHLARAITREHNEVIRDALDVAAGAVLIAAIGAAVVGTILFSNRLAQQWGWSSSMPAMPGQHAMDHAGPDSPDR
jgi:diacylglycerol kinase